MQTNIARGVIVVFTAVVLSGCYSNGGWHMPGTSSPFQSSQGATPDNVGTPVKPAAVAAAGSTAPATGYPTAGSYATAPTVSQGVASGYGPSTAGNGYATAPYSYPPSNATPGVSPTTTTPGYGGTPYVASRSGTPGYGVVAKHARCQRLWPGQYHAGLALRQRESVFHPGGHAFLWRHACVL